MPLDQIYIVTKYEELELKVSRQSKGGTFDRSAWICQRYIQDPMLLDGLKFDCRLYVVVRSLDPLQFYLAKEGMCRFCTEQFSPVTGPKYEPLAHISSFHLNKGNSKYQNSGQTSTNEDSVSSKRSLTTVLRQIRRRARDDTISEITHAKFFESLQPLVGTAVTSMLPVLRASYCRHFGINHEQLLSKPCQAFQLVAFDFVLKEDLTPVLIQANNQPGMSITQLIPNRAGELISERSAVDYAVKTCVLGGALQTVSHLDAAKDMAFAIKRSKEDAADEGVFDKSSKHTGKDARADALDTMYMPVDQIYYEPLEKCYKFIDQMYLKCGGRKKAFQPAVLKRALAEIPNLFHKKFTKPDLTIITANYRGMTKQVKEASSDQGIADDLAIITFAQLLIQISCKSAGSDQFLLSRMIMMLEHIFGVKERDKVPTPPQSLSGLEGATAATTATAAESNILQSQDDVRPDTDDVATASNASMTNGNDVTITVDGGDAARDDGAKTPRHLLGIDRLSERAGSAISTTSALSDSSELGLDASSGNPLQMLAATRAQSKREGDQLVDTQRIIEENMAGYLASDAEQEARILQLEKRVASLSELVCVLLPHAKSRFASEDEAVKSEVKVKMKEQLLRLEQIKEQNKERKKAMTKQKQLREAIRQKQKQALASSTSQDDMSVDAEVDAVDTLLRRRRSPKVHGPGSEKANPLKLPQIGGKGAKSKSARNGGRHKGRT